MASILWWLAQSALVAALLMAIVGIVCRYLHRWPSVQHALWVAVLIKLMMPPVVHWPWGVQDWFPAANSKGHVAERRNAGDAETQKSKSTSLAAGHDEFSSNVADAPNSQRPRVGALGIVPSNSKIDQAASFPVQSTLTVLFVVWLLGAALVLSWKLQTAIRTHRILAKSLPAPEALRLEIDRIAGLLRMRSVPARVAPSTDFLVNPDSPLASEVVTFSASATPNKVLSYTWHFGDGTTLNNAARTVQHLYTQSGVYDVTLEIVGFDNRVYSTHRSLSIPEEETGPLAARFNAYELVSMVPAVNPATSEQQIGADGEPVWDEQWREIDLANEQIELGLRIKFDASESTGAANFIWGFGGMGESAQYAFSEPGTYQVRLDAYNATWTELDTVTTTIHVVNRMDLVDVMSSVNRDASDMAIDGNIAWVTRRTDELVAIDISNPSNLVRVDSFSAPSGWRVAAGQGRVYVARGSFGLDVHSQAISPGSRSVTTFDTFAADGQYVTDVVADGNLVYIAGWPGRFEGFECGQSSESAIGGECVTASWCSGPMARG